MENKNKTFAVSWVTTVKPLAWLLEFVTYQTAKMLQGKKKKKKKKKSRGDRDPQHTQTEKRS
jgi:hypothetical protein